MCFSVQVEKDLIKISNRFNAEISHNSFKEFHDLQKYESRVGFESIKHSLGLKRKPSKSRFQEAGSDGRVYPNTFAPVIVIEDGKRLIKPMRYRIRPHGSQEEIPSKYNVFNARLDSLENRKTWNSIFLKNHGIFPFIKFYEWVDKNGKATLVSFKPIERDLMWAPCLFDTWTSQNNEITFNSFALITTDPPKEVSEAGHDRCPIFLKEANIDNWLTTEKITKADVYPILNEVEQTQFSVSN